MEIPQEQRITEGQKLGHSHCFPPLPQGLIKDQLGTLNGRVCSVPECAASLRHFTISPLS